MPARKRALGEAAAAGATTSRNAASPSHRPLARTTSRPPRSHGDATAVPAKFAQA